MLIVTFILGFDDVLFATWCFMVARFSLPVDLFDLESNITQHQMELVFLDKCALYGPQDDINMSRCIVTVPLWRSNECEMCCTTVESSADSHMEQPADF